MKIETVKNIIIIVLALCFFSALAIKGNNLPIEANSYDSVLVYKNGNIDIKYINRYVEHK